MASGEKKGTRDRSPFMDWVWAEDMEDEGSKRMEWTMRQVEEVEERRMREQRELELEKLKQAGITLEEYESYKNKRLELFNQGKYVPAGTTLATNPIQKFFESCIGKAAVSGVMGGGMGFLFGMLFSNQGMSDPSFTKKPAMLQVKDTFRSVGRNGLSYAKGFGSAGLLFAGSQCVIDKWRGRSDIMNNVAAGCVAGMALSYKGGPQAMAIGCVGFAGFSYVIDSLLEDHDPRDDMELLIPKDEFDVEDDDLDDALAHLGIDQDEVENGSEKNTS